VIDIEITYVKKGKGNENGERERERDCCNTLLKKQ
jgi:hypothetical protein